MGRMKSCIVKNCKGCPSAKVKTHTFPLEPARFQAWAQAINRNDLDFEKRRCYRLCDLHFSDDQKFDMAPGNRTNLKRSAIPNLHLPDPLQISETVVETRQAAKVVPSDDSSDDENLDLLREAADFQFFNDDMYKKSNEKQIEIVISTEKQITNQILPSTLRKTKDDDEQFNFFRVTPEFRNHVAKHLSKILDEQLEEIYPNENNEEVERSKRKRGGIKLFKNDDCFIKIRKKENNLPKTKYRGRRVKEHTEEELEIIVVDLDDITKEVQSWSNRSKAPVYKFKQLKTGELIKIGS